MTTAAVVYRSATGTTRQLAEEIGAHLRAKGVDATVRSVGDADPAALATADLVLLGCWTSGLFVIAQHPDEPWLAFVRDLPPLPNARVGLFTTYKLVTGSMFPRMRAALGGRTPHVDLELKVRGAHLTDAGRAALDRFAGVATETA
ncbi:MAG TPA: flavodoxin domain-containing protein [Candidatus Limnocylindrales bacterium]|jgi:flavodoxin